VSEATLDWERAARTGVAEALLCEGKTAAQIAAILSTVDGRRLLLTRLLPERYRELPGPVRASLDYDPISATAVLGPPAGAARPGAAIVCAGTSDLPVAHEAARTLAFHGYAGPVFADVGVAGLWRLTNRIGELRAFTVLIAVAGMEGALFSVLAGLVEAPVIAVPRSVGYGIATGGHAALTTALASCAPGLVVVNIDNGFGAACAAIKMLRIENRFAAPLPSAIAAV
jgi:NCAIR mutase (PurE)-related protein